ncbi:MAG: flagellar hook capping FlgD N-terminal domain-containing protein [Rubrivivax sp.]|nr:flagellar hook capping FlgD N-terminal domain-containing protein [Rubrivivax sp.]
MITSTAAVDPYATLASSTASSTAATSATSAETDRFLKLLVTQMQNQDPLNPMDNAEITSQMAQLSTVEGIANLNTTVLGMNTQFVQMQALQGAALVGHDITLQGNRVAVDGSTGVGGFEMAGAADKVKIEILSASGRVVETLDLGAESAGRHAFTWDSALAADGNAYTFRVTATSGAATVPTTPLMRDRVQAVSSSASGLVLQTEHSGDIAYSDVKAFN